ncbi:hypothetical protein [Deinococcus navajonensis]|uniref:Uncharacterized protein n=1 Tax=Deinococcus navajonensis TaxID=309884 RepID=A0ABV8XQT0_9DEIO
MTLESSEQEFTSRFAPYAAQGTLYASREGSPLLEFTAGGRVLYLFDRNGPYAASPGPAQVIVHGVLEPGGLQRLPDASPEEGRNLERPEEKLTVLGISALEGQGRVLAVSRQVWVVQARVPLVLASWSPVPQVHEGDWVTFRTAPPLHGFVVGSAAGGSFSR